MAGSRVSFSVGERKIMNHFVVKNVFRFGCAPPQLGSLRLNFLS
jgi:hypothetical protein